MAPVNRIAKCTPLSQRNLPSEKSSALMNTVIDTIRMLSILSRANKVSLVQNVGRKRRWEMECVTPSMQDCRMRCTASEPCKEKVPSPLFTLAFTWVVCHGWLRSYPDAAVARRSTSHTQLPQCAERISGGRQHSGFLSLFVNFSLQNTAGMLLTS